MSINFKNCSFRLSQFMGSERFILVSQNEKTVWKDGKPSDDKYLQVEVTTPESNFEKIAVKLEGKGLDISNDVLNEKNSRLDFTFISFANSDSAKIFTDFRTGEQKISASAKTIELWTEKADDDIVDI